MIKKQKKASNPSFDAFYTNEGGVTGTKYEWTVEDRDNEEYVYRTADMISLPGKKLRMKKNHLNALDRKSTRLNSSHRT